MSAMAHSQDQEPHKRKRDVDDIGSHSDRIPQPPPPQSGNEAPINYLFKANPARLRLIQGDGDLFADVLSLISDYEGVLGRNESVAGNLGAKLTGPRLVKAMEGVFEGAITVSSPNPLAPASISWLDIVIFAKAHPNEFNVTPTPDRGRVCQFYLKGAQVEISEDDWRLIMSGALDRFRLAPPQPIEEDERAELATLDIIEQRLQFLIKKADEVARRARQLNYHLSGRKAAIGARLSGPQFPSALSPTTRPSSSYDLHADLLQQFLSPASQATTPRPSSHAHTPSASLPRQQQQQQQQQQAPVALGPGNTAAGAAGAAVVRPPESGSGDDPSEPYRALITARIDRVPRGLPLYPPCDRCRRLRLQCAKNLTACLGCTRKHAKCAWRTITEEEIAFLRAGTAETEGEGGAGADDDGGSTTTTTREPPTTGGSTSAGRLSISLGELRPRQDGAPSTPGLGLGLGTPVGSAGGPRRDEMGMEREFGAESDLSPHAGPRANRDAPMLSDPGHLSRVAYIASAAAEAREGREVWGGGGGGGGGLAELDVRSRSSEERE